MHFSSLNRCLSLYGWIVSPTVDVSFHFPEWQSCFCPGTGLVSGIQGSRWGPGFLQDQTKLTVIPGILLLQRNESELFVWSFFYFFSLCTKGFPGKESPYRRHIDVNLFSRFKVNWGVVKAVWTSGHWKYFQLAFYLTLRHESEIRQAKQMVRWLWQTIIKTT